jgi:RHS repeat-associated protein
LLAAGNNNGSYTFTYDSDSRLVSETEPFGITLTFGYDADGNRTLVQDSFGGTLTSTYNTDQQLASRRFSGRNNAQLRFDPSWNADGQLANVQRYTDVAGTQLVGSSRIIYDGDGHITDLRYYDGSGTTLTAYTDVYGQNGTLITESVNGVGTTYGYDANNQLTSAGSTSYSYDANGNPTGPGYVIGPDNRLLSDGTWTYSYDAEGNLIKRSKGTSAETWTYGYDNANHLIWVEQRATDGGTLLLRDDFQYDVFGNRIEKDVTQGGSTAVQRFAYLDQNAWADLDGNNQLVTRRVYLDGIDQLVARLSAGGTAAWYLPDREGSVRDITSAAGSIQDTLVYGGFGDLVSESNPSAGDRFGFTGRERDTETELVYFRARYEAPWIGRWISQDPMGFDAGDTNLYRFIANSPTNATDPTGKFLFVANDEQVLHYVLQNLKAGEVKVGTKNLGLTTLIDLSMNTPEELEQFIAQKKSAISENWLRTMIGASLDPDVDVKVRAGDASLVRTNLRHLTAQAVRDYYRDRAKEYAALVGPPPPGMSIIEVLARAHPGQRPPVFNRRLPPPPESSDRIYATGAQAERNEYAAWEEQGAEEFKSP